MASGVVLPFRLPATPAEESEVIEQFGQILGRLDRIEMKQDEGIEQRHQHGVALEQLRGKVNMIEAAVNEMKDAATQRASWRNSVGLLGIGGIVSLIVAELTGGMTAIKRLILGH